MAVSAVIALLGGCVPASHRAHPVFHTTKDRIKIIGVLPPRAEVYRQFVYQKEAGGQFHKLDDRSIEAEKLLFAAVLKELQTRPGVTIKTVPEAPISEQAERNLFETHGLFGAVNEGILERVYAENRNIEEFDYTLGPEVQGLGYEEVDALLIIRAIEKESVSVGSEDADKAAKVLLGLLWLAAIAVPPLLPVAAVTAGGITLVGASVQAGMLLGAITATGAVSASGKLSDFRGAYVSMALAEPRTGKILWYNIGDGKTLADSQLEQILKKLLDDLPLGEEQRRRF